jgi:hypothetical protein
MWPNERFSGGNHPRHLCRECAHLPAEEREYRRGESDIERLLHDGLYVPRRRRAQFSRFLEHPNARVRDLARRILAEQRRHAEERVRMRDEDEALGETLERTHRTEAIYLAGLPEVPESRPHSEVNGRRVRP